LRHGDPAPPRPRPRVRRLARTLRPGGSALFYEPLGHNPAINLYRRLTPELRTEDEHPVHAEDLDRARQWFGRVEERYFHTTALAAAAGVYGHAPFDPLLAGLEHLDRAPFRLSPAARRWACCRSASQSSPVGDEAVDPVPALPRGGRGRAISCARFTRSRI
jgi:SAM-dependent methyltransferase